MRVRIGVGLAAAVLLSLAALSASAAKSGDEGPGGNAWGTNLAELKGTASSDAGNGHGNAWGLMLADIKAKRGHGEDADAEDDDRGEHVLTTGSLPFFDAHSRGNHTGLRSPEQGDDQTPPGGVGGTPPPTDSTPHDVAAVPEPSAALLFAAGTGFVLMSLRRPRG
jgi:hypothetical protein